MDNWAIYDHKLKIDLFFQYCIEILREFITNGSAKIRANCVKKTSWCKKNNICNCEIKKKIKKNSYS